MKNDLIERTFDFSNKVIDLVELLPLNIASKVVSYQIIKSGTSVGANYRASQ
jgi:four helix bundle protein